VNIIRERGKVFFRIFKFDGDGIRVTGRVELQRVRGRMTGHIAGIVSVAEARLRRESDSSGMFSSYNPFR
jgi:hypothetical protein